MPILPMFYGIVVRMYYFDNKQHHVPHVHTECSGDQAVFAITDGAVLAGELPSGKTRIVQAWIEIHRDELLPDRQLAVNGEEVFKIEPLKIGRPMNPRVKSVCALDDYKLVVLFENGESRRFDVKPYLERGIFARLCDHAVFQVARVVACSVEWPAGLDLSYDTLYLEGHPIVAPPSVTKQGVPPAAQKSARG